MEIVNKGKGPVGVALLEGGYVELMPGAVRPVKTLPGTVKYYRQMEVLNVHLRVTDLDREVMAKKKAVGNTPETPKLPLAHGDVGSSMAEGARTALNLPPPPSIPEVHLVGNDPDAYGYRELQKLTNAALLDMAAKRDIAIPEGMKRNEIIRVLVGGE